MTTTDVSGGDDARPRLTRAIADPEVAARLKLARKAAGFKTASEASRRFGWNLNTYAGHEHGTRGITTRSAPVYAAAFGVRVEWLLLGHGEPRTADAVFAENVHLRIENAALRAGIAEATSLLESIRETIDTMTMKEASA